ncbi:MAG TPA: hypothetical protein PK637_08860 [Flavobacteriales bacterium]|nr:hypothetical protein [Flavobacteriales bacterium]HRE96862.1 hypothetical protein [Flavobacteriales bacterium]HRJ35805.1 hypothetical protein [Flavobacteriales bacterium]HRJ38517.1 hypothetical protein [Flavobacteriales bacterium]
MSRSLLVFFLFSLFSCMTTPQGDKRSAVDCVEILFFGKNTGDIAGISIGDPSSAVMDARVGTPLYQDDLETIDSVSLCNEKNGHAELACRFVSGRLAEMELTLFLKQETDLDPVFNLIKTTMDQRHDGGMQQQGVWFWQRNRERFLDQIYLLNASDRYKRPVVQMLLSDGEGTPA